MRRGNPKPSIAVDQRAIRPFDARVQITLPFNGNTNFGSQWRVYRSPSIELRGFTAPEAFVSLSLSWLGFAPTFALIGQLVAGIGSPGAIGPISALSNGIPLFPGKGGINMPGIYELNALTMGAQAGQAGAGRHICGGEAWFELWALGRKAAPNNTVEIGIDGVLVAGRSYSR